MPFLRRASVLLARLAVAVAPVMAAPDLAWAQEAPRDAAPASDRSEALHDQLAHADSALFDALFARCDAERASALLATDVEFYDDRTGLSAGSDLRADFRRLTESCPAANGVRRILLPGSVEVHPIPGYGAVQTGVHHFVERNASTTTVARFVHVWQRIGDEWRLARIISIHEIMDSARAAGLRR